jgi:sialic acid synthase SpsE
MELIAEVGLNHRGDKEAARRMLGKLLDAGVRKITFQIRETAFYDGSKPWKHQLPFDVYEEAISVTGQRGAQLGFAVADEAMVPRLAAAGAAFFKSLSWDLGNRSIQAAFSATGKLTWVSTGVSGMDEIAAIAREGREVGFIHTQLSAAVEDQNVRAIETIRAATGRPVAYGLHCADHRVLYLALAFNPEAVFVYVKEDGPGPYPDDAHAVRVTEIPALISDLRSLPRAAGDGQKRKMERKL